MDAYEYEPIDWSIDLARRDWRLEAVLGVSKGRPFNGVRLARYPAPGPAKTRRFQIWEESQIVIPSTPQTALIAIGNVLSGAINFSYEAMARLNAEEAARKYGARHRRK